MIMQAHGSCAGAPAVMLSVGPTSCCDRAADSGTSNAGALWSTSFLFASSGIMLTTVQACWQRHSVLSNKHHSHLQE